MQCRPSLGVSVVLLYVLAIGFCLFLWQKLDSTQQAKEWDERIRADAERRSAFEAKFEQHANAHATSETALKLQISKLQTDLAAAKSAASAKRHVPPEDDPHTALIATANAAVEKAATKQSALINKLEHQIKTLQMTVAAQTAELDRQREAVAVATAAATAAAKAAAPKPTQSTAHGHRQLPKQAWEEQQTETEAEEEEEKAVVAPKTSVSELNIVWDFGSCGCTGWAMETIVFIMELVKVMSPGRLAIIAGENCFCPGLSEHVMSTLVSLQHPKPAISKWPSIDVFISHKPASRYPVWPYRGVITIPKRPRYVIGRSMIETYDLPSDWPGRIKSDVDEVWLPATFLVDVFRRSRVPQNKLFVIPEAVDLSLYNPDRTEPFVLPPPIPAAEADDQELEISDDDDQSGSGSAPPTRPPPPAQSSTEPAGRLKSFKFFSLFKWEDRKGWDILLKSFVLEFNPSDDVALYIHTYLYGESDQNARSVMRVRQRIDKFLKTVKKPCPKSLHHKSKSGKNQKKSVKCEFPDLERQLIIMTNELDTSDMPALYKSMSAFVMPTRGEGWGLPIMEAMAMGLPTIATNWSGPTDFMTPTNSYPLPITGLVPVSGRDFEAGQKWAAPDGVELQRLMRHVFENQAEAKARGAQARSDMLQYFSPSVVTGLLVQRLQQIVDTGIFPASDHAASDSAARAATHPTTKKRTTKY